MILGNLASSRGCDVTEINSQTEKQCVFPFKINQRTYMECTDNFDPDGKFWCSTKVDNDTGVHIGGQKYWGFCKDPACFTTTTLQKKDQVKNTQFTSQIGHFFRGL